MWLVAGSGEEHGERYPSNCASPMLASLQSHDNIIYLCSLHSIFLVFGFAYMAALCDIGVL